MFAENRKIIVWFLVAIALAVYVKTSGFILPGQAQKAVLGKSTVSSPGFGPLLDRNK
ncbi:hypothetical protein HY440_01535 [Candidatus Microgenomates bacterium]|nr:hypothetical protein [Candidatus Microgenomates bacterium]